MINIEFSPKELAYLLLSLQKYELALLEQEGEDMENVATDLMFVQSLSLKFQFYAKKKHQNMLATNAARPRGLKKRRRAGYAAARLRS